MKKHIVYVSAIWCPSCLIMQSRYLPYFTHPSIQEVKRLDYDDDIQQLQPYQIGHTLPVLMVFEEEREILRVVGEKSKKELHDIFQKVGL